MQAAIRLIVVLLALPLAQACAPLSEEQRYDREHRLTLAREEYAQKAAYCESMGGSMSMELHALRQPTLVDYRAARCVKR